MNFINIPESEESVQVAIVVFLSWSGTMAARQRIFTEFDWPHQIERQKSRFCMVAQWKADVDVYVYREMRHSEQNFKGDQ